MNVEITQTQQSAIAERYDFAKTICRQAGELTLDWFQKSNLAVDKKDDRSPVTAADRAAETFLREQISQQFPDDGIVGEEFGVHETDNNVRWILDPIDGTKSFITGVPLFGTMIGVEVDGQPVVGVVAFPGLDEMIYAAAGQGAFYVKGRQREQKAAVRNRTDLSDAIFVTSEAKTFGVRGAVDVYEKLQQHCYITRTWGDAYGYFLVATGRADLMVDPNLSIWDAAAVKPIIDEAGGIFVDWNGVPSIESGDAIGTNAALLPQILEITKPAG